MVEIESEKVYLRLEPSESIEYKKTMLGVLVNLIQSQIISKRFDELRRAEIKMTRQLKTNVNGIQEELDKILELLPKKAMLKEERWEKKLKKGKRKGEEIELEVKRKEIAPKISGKARKYQSELESIKSMLAKLG